MGGIGKSERCMSDRGGKRETVRYDAWVVRDVRERYRKVSWVPWEIGHDTFSVLRGGPGMRAGAVIRVTVVHVGDRS